MVWGGEGNFLQKVSFSLPNLTASLQWPRNIVNRCRRRRGALPLISSDAPGVRSRNAAICPSFSAGFMVQVMYASRPPDGRRATRRRECGAGAQRGPQPVRACGAPGDRMTGQRTESAARNVEENGSARRVGPAPGGGGTEQRRRRDHETPGIVAQAAQPGLIGVARGEDGHAQLHKRQRLAAASGAGVPDGSFLSAASSASSTSWLPAP